MGKATPSSVTRPLCVVVCSFEPQLAEALRRKGGDRVTVIDRRLTARGAVALVKLLLELKGSWPDLVVVDPGVSGLVRLVVGAVGWRTVVADAVGITTGSVADLAQAAARPGAGLREGPEVSVVATVLNEIEVVDEMVSGVLSQLKVGDEFVVADGGSSDGTLETLRRLARGPGGLRLVEAPGANISAGRNAAIRSARHGVIVCADAGCEPGEGWLDALRMPFGDGPPAPGLVAGVPVVAGSGPLETAQAAACYPDPFDAAHPALAVRLYARLFGSSFSPAVPFARVLAFTKEAWQWAGGFPEDLGWVEDGAFGLAVAKRFDCQLVTDAEVRWVQRTDLRSTFTMYRNYGTGAFQSGDRLFLLRDGVRVVAYLLCLASLRRRWASLRPALLAGGGAYLSLPVVRARRRGAGPAALALIPVALLTKDIGKISGEVSGALRRRRPR